MSLAWAPCPVRLPLCCSPPPSLFSYQFQFGQLWSGSWEGERSTLSLKISWKIHLCDEIQSFYSFILALGRKAPRSPLAWKPQVFRVPCGAHPPWAPLLTGGRALRAHRPAWEAAGALPRDGVSGGGRCPMATRLCTHFCALPPPCSLAGWLPACVFQALVLSLRSFP